MLIVVSDSRVINLESFAQISIENGRDAAYLKFGSGTPVKCPSLDAAKSTLAGIVDAYAHGDKVFYLNRE